MILLLLTSLFASSTLALNFTIAGGQIFTPGFSVLDAPQPGTPLGGESLNVALDVTANGRLQLPPYPENSPSQIFNITMFLYSYGTGKNFTISNGTEGTSGASLGEIMAQEEGSTVKHVNWIWPDCLVGDGQPKNQSSDRGVYNISIRQNFRLNGVDHYTIFDVPISVTNRIAQMNGRPSCDELLNPLLSPEEINVDGANDVGVLFAPGDSTVVESGGTKTAPAGSSGSNGANANGISDGGQDALGPSRPEAKPSDGLGGAGSLSPRGAGNLICLAALVMSLI